MALATDKTAVITENLADAGLGKKEIAECLKMIDQHEFSALQNFFPIIVENFLTVYMSITIRLIALTISHTHSKNPWR